MLQLLVTLQVLGTCAGRRWHARSRLRTDAGQSTAEYALVLLGAASVALLLVAWATKTDRITELLDGVVDGMLDKVS
jgi:hypothetical protein